MKIVLNGAEVPIKSIYEDDIYEGLTSRPALHILPVEDLTPDQAAAIIGATIEVFDDDGTIIKTIQPYDRLLSFEIVFTKESDLEREVRELRTERDDLAGDKALLQAQVREMGAEPVSPNLI